MKKRAFVLVPLLEITPDLVLPDGQSARQALELISYRQEGDRIWQDEPGAGSRNREIPSC
jgi:2-amino-4-hydroxy-6-hydroxymethyldihydropteridine diphosphokinase